MIGVGRRLMLGLSALAAVALAGMGGGPVPMPTFGFGMGGALHKPRRTDRGTHKQMRRKQVKGARRGR